MYNQYDLNTHFMQRSISYMTQMFPQEYLRVTKLNCLKLFEIVVLRRQ